MGYSAAADMPNMLPVPIQQAAPIPTADKAIMWFNGELIESRTLVKFLSLKSGKQDQHIPRVKQQGPQHSCFATCILNQDYLLLNTASLNDPSTPQQERIMLHTAEKVDYTEVSTLF